ncbi:hypothetical protein H2O64_08970 [Kordia sp. YSTF-M3]|uniref:DUF5362 domain-containing protein n=1 Tax=Kordia aestuariivivens TaxID=2759037 RepID=A0ABR7Q8C2_9FLAO|nr:DUF5362 family protein [Kordia aestuariivivens]MBC8754800.1 hypothetical protein [Kordia aestuariivivens]
MPFRKQDSSVFDNFELRLNESSKKFLRETAKWAFILAIIGFIMIGIFVFVAVFFLVMFTALNSSVNPFVQSGLSVEFVAIVYFVMALLYFFPVLYLYKFSRKMKSALIEKNTEDLTLAFSNLKSFFKFIGITVLIFLGLYILILGFSIIAGVSAQF